MIPVTGYRGAKVAVLGLGRSGLATAAALRAGGAEPLLWDDSPEARAKADAEGGECFACRLTRRRPASYDSEALAKLAETSVAKRRMLAQLATLGLPIETYHEREGGLAFDLLSSRSGQG